MLKLGNTTINKLMLGSTEAKKVYLGSTLVHDTTGGGAFAPTDLTNLIAWYDASDTSTITHSSGAVSQLNDKSGDSHHLTQATGSAQPTTGTRTINSLNVLDFDGGDFMAKTSFPLPSSGNVIFAALFTIDSESSVNDSAFSVDATVDFQFESGSATQFDGDVRASGTGTSLIAGTILNLTTFIVALVYDFTGGTTTTWINGSSSASGTYSTKLSASQVLNLMTNRAQNVYPNGAFAEMAICEEVDTTSRQKLEGYLAHKWAQTSLLPGGHPYKSTAP